MKTRPGMRWSCEEMGCFLKKKVVPLYEFDDCFGGNIGLTDLDGIVERNGHFLFVEWKAKGERLPIGQQILFRQLTLLSDNIVVLVVNGNSNIEKGTQPEELTVIYKGKAGEPEKAGLDQLRDFFKRWYRWADNREEFNGTRS